jgi:hypothetical protein
MELSGAVSVVYHKSFYVIVLTLLLQFRHDMVEPPLRFRLSSTQQEVFGLLGEHRTSFRFVWALNPQFVTYAGP